MPSLDDVLRENLLGKKFGFGKNLDRKLTTANQASSILNSVIEFVPARNRYEDESKELKTKYKRLICKKKLSNGQNCTTGPSTSNDTTSLQTNITLTKQNSDSDLPPPIFDIFPVDKVRLTWDEKLKRSTAVGLHNLGNTCFLNSILQVLTNTAPLVNHLLNNEHDIRQCPAASGFCALCLTKSHIQRVFSCSNGGTISPNSIVNRARCIMKSHAMGRQEDAHEFLRYFIDAMQTAALHAYKTRKLDLHTKETSVIGRIFGGYLKNEVICNKCRYSSTTYDPFLDISIEVKQQQSLEAALSHFTRPETLTNENAYKCPKCKVRVSARKMFTIHQAPNILTIQLKRFDHMGKIDRYIPYTERLSLRPYMTEKQGPSVNYKLYGVVVHHGRSTRSGHYTAYARNPCDQWHLLDDSRASAVSPNNALRCSGAYLLFYIRNPIPVATVKPQVSPMSRSAVVEHNGKGKEHSNGAQVRSAPTTPIKPTLIKMSSPFTPIPRPTANNADSSVKAPPTGFPHRKHQLSMAIVSPVEAVSSVQETNCVNAEMETTATGKESQIKMRLREWKEERRRKKREKKLKRLKKKQEREGLGVDERAVDGLKQQKITKWMENGHSGVKGQTNGECMGNGQDGEEGTGGGWVTANGTHSHQDGVQKMSKKRKSIIENEQNGVESKVIRVEGGDANGIEEMNGHNNENGRDGMKRKKKKKKKHEEVEKMDDGQESEKKRKRKLEKLEKLKKKKLKKATRDTLEVNGHGENGEMKNVVEELEKSRMFGYSWGVKTWDVVGGDFPTLGDNDTTEENSVCNDEWNEEFDTGRVKKRKKRRGQFMCLGLNPFQVAQNSMNRREQTRRMAVV